jgi:hypothetical protein
MLALKIISYNKTLRLIGDDKVTTGSLVLAGKQKMGIGNDEGVIAQPCVS